MRELFSYQYVSANPTVYKMVDTTKKRKDVKLSGLAMMSVCVHVNTHLKCAAA
jgi:hypothetical protein